MNILHLPHQRRNLGVSKIRQRISPRKMRQEEHSSKAKRKKDKERKVGSRKRGSVWTQTLEKKGFVRQKESEKVDQRERERERKENQRKEKEKKITFSADDHGDAWEERNCQQEQEKGKEHQKQETNFHQRKKKKKKKKKLLYEPCQGCGTHRGSRKFRPIGCGCCHSP
jgi:hypothetical protein